MNEKRSIINISIIFTTSFLYVIVARFKSPFPIDDASCSQVLLIATPSTRILSSGVIYRWIYSRYRFSNPRHSQQNDSSSTTVLLQFDDLLKRYSSAFFNNNLWWLDRQSTPKKSPGNTLDTQLIHFNKTLPLKHSSCPFLTTDKTSKIQMTLDGPLSW